MAVDLRARNREIGALIKKARQKLGKTIQECAEYMGTSRRRYAELEGGRARIGAAELEVLIPFLEISLHEVWPVILGEKSVRQVASELEALIRINRLAPRDIWPMLLEDRSLRQIPVDLEPCEIVQFIVRVASGVENIEPREQN